MAAVWVSMRRERHGTKVNVLRTAARRVITRVRIDPAPEPAPAAKTILNISGEPRICKTLIFEC